MKALEIGSTENPRIRITVIGYERTETGDPYDENWLTANVELRIGGFTGSYDASFFTQDFITFKHQLDSLYNSLAGIADFGPLENQLSIKLSGNGLGKIEVTGSASDSPHGENQLTFSFELDQTYLNQMIRQLNELIHEYPSRPA